MTLRTAIAWIGSAAAALAACGGSASPPPAADPAAHARGLHARMITVDTHCDTPMRLLGGGWKIGERHEPGLRASGKIDLPRMVEGGLDAEFFAVFVGQGPRTPEGYAAARERAVAVLDAIQAMPVDYPDLVGLAYSPADAVRLKAEGKRIAFIGLENGYPLGLDATQVRYFHERGVRYITLVHSSDNDICDSSTDRREPEDRGLSDFGRQVVAECNRAGVMVDVSHASDQTFYDVLEASRAPVIASHSCARALCDNPRNLSDDMIRALAAKGGVVQICFLSAYVRPPDPDPERDAALRALQEKYGDRRQIQDPAVRAQVMADYQALNERYPQKLATVKDLVDHIDHVKRLVGIDYAGIGTDFDGGGGLADCDDVTGMMRVTEEMIRRGYSDAEIEKVWSGNIFRVFDAVTAKAREIAAGV